MLASGLSSFLIHTFNAINVPLCTAFAAPHNFLYFNFHLVQKILKFLFKIIIKSVFGDFPVPFYLFPQSLR